MTVPRLAITMGDPSGVGPEIVAKALSRSAIYRWCRPVVIGDRRLLSILPLTIKSRFDVIDMPVPGREILPGKISRASGKAAYLWRQSRKRRLRLPAYASPATRNFSPALPAQRILQ